MSFRYEEEIQRKSRVTTPDFLFEQHEPSFHRNRFYAREWGVPIPRCMTTALFVQSEVTRAFCTDTLEYDPPETSNPALNGELKRFIVSLKAYYDSSNPIIPLSFLINGITDFDFASLLKKIRVKQIVTSTAVVGEFLDSEDWTDIPTWTHFRDIGDIFNYGYWFFWEEPDPHDEQHCFRTVETIPEETLNDLYDICFDMLPEDPPVVIKQDVLTQISSSTALSQSFDDSKQWKEREIPSNTQFSSGHIKGKKAYVQKKPCDSRAALVLPLPISNSVRFIEKQLANVAAMMVQHGSIYVKQEPLFEAIRQRFRRRWTYFLCRDIEKDGLTKPRQLLKPIIEALKSKYRRVFDTTLLDIFHQFEFQIDGKWTVPPRGVGLGMSSALTTILQCVVFRYTILRIREKIGRPDFKAGCLVYHDDFVAGFTNKEDYEEFDYEEDLVFKELQLIRKKKKSWAGSEFVICERYSHDQMNRKESYQIRLTYLPFAAANITQAKVLFSQCVRYNLDIDWTGLLKKLVHYWGYEFFPNEANYPIEFGGWFPFLFRDVNTCLTAWNDNESENLARSYEASKFSKMIGLNKPQYAGMQYRDPLSLIAEVPLDDLPDDLKREYMIDVPKTRVAETMSRFNFPSAQFNGWRRLYDKRIDVYANCKPKSYGAICCEIRDLNNSVDYVIKEPNRVRLIPWDSSMIRNEPYPLLNTMSPQLSLINHYCPGAFPKRIPCPVNPGIVPLNGYPSTNLNRLRYLQKDFEDPLTFGTEKVRDYYFHDEYIDIKGSGWIDPTSVCLYYWDKHGMQDIPANPGTHAQAIRDYEDTVWYMILAHPDNVQLQNMQARRPREFAELLQYVTDEDSLTLICNHVLSLASELQAKKEMLRRVDEGTPEPPLPTILPQQQEDMFSQLAGLIASGLGRDYDPEEQIGGVIGFNPYATPPQAISRSPSMDSLDAELARQQAELEALAGSGDDLVSEEEESELEDQNSSHSHEVSLDSDSEG